MSTEQFKMCVHWLSWLAAVALFIVGCVAILAGIVWAGDWIIAAAGLS